MSRVSPHLRVKTKFAGVAILAGIFLISSAQAYRKALIASDQVEVKESASPNAFTKVILPRGTKVNTSDYAKNGYYWIHSATQSGWVRASDLGFITSIAASGASDVHRDVRFRVLSFRLNQVTALQSGGNSSFSGEISWNPAIRLWRNFSLLGNFGLSEYKNQYGSDILILEYQALASLALGRWSLEAGAGAQRWDDTGNSYLALSGNILYRLGSPIWHVLDQVFFGYTSVSIPTYSTQVFKIGVVVDL